MKICACPPEVPFADANYKHFDLKVENARVEAHKKNLKAWMIQSGCKGQHTGAIISFPVADGYAEYMLADGPKSFLVHLPYWDGYRYPDVQFLPKSEIIRRAEQQEKIAALLFRVHAV